VLGIALGFDMQIDRHPERVEILRDLALHPEAFRGTENCVFQLEFGGTVRFHPLNEEVAKLLSELSLSSLPEILCSYRFPGILLKKLFNAPEELLVAQSASQHLHNDGALVGAERPVFG